MALRLNTNSSEENERRIFNIRKRDKIKNKETQKNHNNRNVELSLKKMQFKYLGHIIRTKYDEWSYKNHSKDTI